MTESTAIDDTTPWCGSCERHSEYQTRGVRDPDGYGYKGTIAIFNECNQLMLSPSLQRTFLRLFHYFLVPMVLIRTPNVDHF